METILLSLLLSSILYNNVHSAAFPKRTIESFIIHYLEDRRIIPVRVVLNAEQQTEHIVTPVGGETLYDFNEGKVAYKDQNSSQCFIANIMEESLERDRRKLKNIQHGIVRGFYLPTFTIQQEFNNNTNLSEKFGIRLTEFCRGNIISSVTREQQRRNKRDTSGEKGQFTHHSYGHYGHQSNNYAHYGHETYVTGKVDKDGNIRDRRVSHNQVRSESSQTYPASSSRTGPQTSTVGSGNGIYNPQYQTQYQIPASQSWDTGGRSFGTGSGQFALQTNHESGYQLNLPLGLRSGNAYRGGIRSSGQYSVGGPQPQIATELQRYPDSVSPGIYKPSPDGQRQIPGQVSSIPTVLQPPVPSTQVGDRRVGIPAGVPGYQDLAQTRVSQPLPGTGDIGLRGLSAQVDHTRTGDRGLRTPDRVPGYQDLDQTRIAQPLPVTREISLHGLPPQVDHTRIGDRGLGTPVGVPGYQDLSQPRISQPLPGSRDGSSGGLPTHLQPGVSAPSPSTIIGSHPIRLPSGVPATQFDSRVGAPGQPGTDYQTLDGRVIDRRQPDSGTQTIQRITGQQGFPTVFQPGAGTLPTDHLIPGSVPAMRIPTSYIPGTVTGSLRPGEVTADIGHPRTQITGLQPPPGISRPGYQVSSMHPDFKRQQDFIPGSAIPSQHLQTQDGRYPVDSQIPGLYQPGLYPGIPTERDTQSLTGISIPGIAPSFPQGTLARPGDLSGNGVSYPAGTYPQISGGTRQEYLRGVPRGDVPTGVTRIEPTDGRRIVTTGVQPGDAQILQARETGRAVPDGVRGYQVPSRGIAPDSRISPAGISPGLLTTAGDRSVLTSQTRPGVSGIYGQDSASSQTQIQTNAESTAAEASAAGNYRGLGSQTQVQGGYAGNGSFSAQAQSGFTGGVVQSQVQGSKQGGLSGSSAQVERVGAAQSQVQVGQPSGSASSTAQGRFSGGTTQVQAQSGKTGGSAGAQAQSTGLSSSHVQVNIGGKDVSEQDRFQGTVSASVQGGHAAGQAQTQLQGGYDSGRTYVATAQGGFDSAVGFQGSIPLAGSLPRISNQTLGISPPSQGTTLIQEPGSVLGQRPTVDSTIPLVEQTGRGLPDGTQITQPARTRQLDQRTGITGIPSSSVLTQRPSAFPDQRQPQAGILPEQSAISAGQRRDGTLVSHTPGTLRETLVPGISRPEISPGKSVEDFHLRYPGSVPGSPGSQHLPQISQTHPSYQPGLISIPSGAAAEGPTSVSQQLPGYAAYDTRTSLPSRVIPGSQQTSLPSLTALPGQRIDTLAPMPSLTSLPGVTSPGLHSATGESLSPIPGLQHPLPISSTPQQTFHQQYNYTAIRPPGSFQQPSGLIPVSHTHVESGYPHGYPPGYIPQGQQQGFPTSQIPVSVRPDISGRPGQQVFYPPSFIPGQPQISSTYPQTIFPQARPSYIPGLSTPDDSQYIGLPPGGRQPQTIPGQPQISQPRSQDSLPDTVLPSRIPSQVTATHTTQAGLPGPHEPDAGSCCEALRELQRRCCGKTSRKQNGSSDSSCCKSKVDDFSIDFSSEDGLGEDKSGEPCKVVKAICYIVYKPAGKARVCKPTDTNGC